MELTNWLMVIMTFMGLVMAVMVPLIAHLYNVVHNTTAELSRHQTHIAENYSTKIEVEKLAYRIERQMRDGFDNLKEILTNRREKDAA
ncbi:hypothetical protein ABC502_14510 [Alkalimonas sp. NCh-2]|uniref:hypothetical protein n=1 Tax=Alkalimonas sp. NCh-2 TaxID=3144846 RepID=UPI0031F68A78